MDKDKVTELLSKYPYYKYAVRMYEQDMPVVLQATEYTDMPRGGSFGPRYPKSFGKTLDDINDYEEYSKACRFIEGALETLTDEEQSVIKLRWMNEMTLDQIANRKNYSKATIKRTHKKALGKLVICLRFLEVPHIEQISLGQITVA
ncbi:RNA polymerase factor sigma-32 [compost metagenome]